MIARSARETGRGGRRREVGAREAGDPGRGCDRGTVGSAGGVADDRAGALVEAEAADQARGAGDLVDPALRRSARRCGRRSRCAPRRSRRRRSRRCWRSRRSRSARCRAQRAGCSPHCGWNAVPERACDRARRPGTGARCRSSRHRSRPRGATTLLVTAVVAADRMVGAGGLLEVGHQHAARGVDPEEVVHVHVRRRLGLGAALRDQRDRARDAARAGGDPHARARAAEPGLEREVVAPRVAAVPNVAYCVEPLNCMPVARSPTAWPYRRRRGEGWPACPRRPRRSCRRCR